MPQGAFAMAEHETEMAALLRQAGYQAPPEAVAQLAALLPDVRALLARLRPASPLLEPATVFRPDAQP
jgi:hypothetical protein